MAIRLLLRSFQDRCSQAATSVLCVSCRKTLDKTANRSWHRNFSYFDSKTLLCSTNRTLSVTKGHFSNSTTLFSKTLGENYEDGKLIYIGQLGKSVKRSHFGFYSMGALVMCSTPFLLSALPDSQLMSFCVATYTFFFGILNPSMFYNFAKRYVQELYHNEEKDEYTAHVSSPFVVNNKKIVFSPHSCKMPAKASAFISFYANGVPLFINSDDMNYRSYSRMLRFASDFDYENPERQAQYRDAIKDSINRISKENDKEK